MAHLDRMIQWARVLGVPQKWLWFTLPCDEFKDSTDEHAEVRRRNVLSAGGVAAFATVAPAMAAGVAAGSPVGVSFLADSIADVADAMLGTQALPSECPNVTALTSHVLTAWCLRQRADYTTLGRLVPTLIQLSEASMVACEGDDRERATRVGVHAYNAASSFLKKVGDSQLALLAADRAVRHARSVGDPLLVAAAFYRVANVLLSARRLRDATEVAMHAADLIEPTRARSPRSLATWGGLLLTAAVAAARGAHEPEAWELLGEARTASRQLATDHADLYSIFGPTNVAMHAVQVAVALGRGRDAVRRGQQVNPDDLPAGLVERRGQFLIDIALGHAVQGDDGSALAALMRAELLAPQEVRYSTDVHSLVLRMLHRERRGAIPGLRAFAARTGVQT